MQVVKDLRRCGMEEDWRDVAKDRRAWRCIIRERAEEANEHDEFEEVKRKDDRKQWRENRLAQENTSLTCSQPMCGFVELSRAGFINHCRQKNTSSLSMPSVHTVARLCVGQGLHNHQHFCANRPS